MLDNLGVSTILNEHIEAACPGATYRIGDVTNKATWALNPPATATPAQIAAGNTVLQNFNPVQADALWAQRLVQRASLQDIFQALPLTVQQAVQQQVQARFNGVTGATGTAVVGF